MTSTNRNTLATRISQGVAVAALAAGLAIGSAATAAANFDRDKYNSCIIRGGYIDECCIYAGGDIILDKDGYPATCKDYWTYPDYPAAENVPQPPAPTEPPPVLDSGQTGPSNPLIPVPRGSNSGTLAP